MPAPFKAPGEQRQRGLCFRIATGGGCFLVAAYGFFILWLHTHSQILHPPGGSASHEGLAQFNDASRRQAMWEVARKDREAYKQKQTIEKPSAHVAPPSGVGGEVHVIFSTDCSFYQDWQTLLVFFTAVAVGQKGQVTRIASGCPEPKKEELKQLYQKLFPQYGVHFTPDFKKDAKTGESYDFYNKPYGVQHWLRHNPQVKPHTIVAIIDPDMIFLRPLTAQVAGVPDNIFMRGFDAAAEPPPEFVRRGRPAAQLYGLGAPWAVDRHRHFNRTAVCGIGSPCLKVVPRYGEMHYSVGPPYLVERDDLARLTDTWVTMVPKVYAQYPELLAEMYAYSMAAAHENLPHLTMQHYMVSNTEAMDEGWPWVDALADKTCEPAVQGPPGAGGQKTFVYYPGRPLPTMLHYCQFFRVGEWGFQKRRVPKKLFECEGQLLGEIPRDIALTKYKNRDGEIIAIGQKYARRNSFMLCGIHSAINELLRDFKRRMCTGPRADKINLNMTLNLAKALHW